MRGKRLRVYCHGMREAPLEYLTLPSERNNYAEMYGPRLAGSGVECPSGGKRLDTCPARVCSPDEWAHAGLTVFLRVRVDVKRMRLVSDDWTHARLVSGRAVEFGTAGDCYSAAPAGCPQGRFSIDFGEDARVRIAPHVRWSAHGQSSAARVHVSRDGRKVSGMCGGRCGTCRPDQGLLLEIL